MALHTSILFALCSVGMLLARPGKGLMSSAASTYIGGRSLRRLLPYIVLTPLLTSWLSMQESPLATIPMSLVSRSAVRPALWCLFLLLGLELLLSATRKNAFARRSTAPRCDPHGRQSWHHPNG